MTYIYKFTLDKQTNNLRLGAVLGVLVDFLKKNDNIVKSICYEKSKDLKEKEKKMPSKN